MKKCIAILLATAGLWLGSIAQAADFKGKVTKPDGVTPLSSVSVALYKYNPGTAQYSYYTGTYTDAAGLYKVSTSATGVYLVNFTSGYSGVTSFASPFGTSGYYSNYPMDAYYPETYNDVTALTPTKAPTQFSVTDLAQVFNLALVKLTSITTSNCQATGPITINTVPYSYFNAGYYYYETGPSVPDTGGTLNISFRVWNGHTAAISTNVQALAFLTRQDLAYVSSAHSVRPFATKAYTFPAKAYTNVTLSVAIPAALMKIQPATLSTRWAFNLGIQFANVDKVANCREFMFPVLHPATTASADVDGWVQEEQAEPLPEEMVPLTLSEDGQVLKWGPVPEAQ